MITNRVTCLLTAVGLAVSACDVPEAEAPPAAEAEWQPLFDGEALEGGRIVGDTARFYVEDGMIVGEALLEGGGYLATERTYDDFILEADVKIDPHFNSGIQFRSAPLDRDTTTLFLNGRLERQERTWEAGRIAGYQIEVDPSERAWSGGLYEPSGRGWLVSLVDKPEAQAAFKPDDWNTFRIEARGDTIRTWVNGVPVVDTTDAVRSTGFIGLQAHSAHGEEDAGEKVYWRNLRIRPLD